VATFALIHGGGGSAWDWHLVAAELRERGHVPVAVDLPIEDESAGWWQYVDAVVDALGNSGDVVVVGHSLGGFTAPLVCTRAEARRRERDEASRALQEPWPLEAWPDTPTRYLLCLDDRMFPAAWARRHARERLGPEADEIDGGHYITLSRPTELTDRLVAYAAMA
jgi:pimeloyl-ACP methyl ester carboxylesterase